MAIKRNVRVESVAVLVNVTGGDFLTYKVTVEGPDPTFALVDSKMDKVLMSSHDQSSGGDTWERRWPRPADSVSPSTSHTMGFSFLDAIKYTYVVEHHHGGGITETVIDIDYISEGFESAYFQRLGVTAF